MSKTDTRKTIVLTGASRGIGHATVKRFSREGWRVITCSRQAFSEDCPWPQGPEDHIRVDLTDPEDVGLAVADTGCRRWAASCMRWSTMPASRRRCPKAGG